MTKLFLVRLAVLNTFKKRLRIILALGGIALTVSAVVTLFGVQTGLQNIVDAEVKNGQYTDVVTVALRNAQKIKLDEEHTSDIRSISGIGEMSEAVGLYGTSVYHGISLNSAVYAVSSNYFSMTPFQLYSGDVTSQPDENRVIVSTKTLDIFGIDPESAIDKSIDMALTIPREYADGLGEETSSVVAKNTYTVAAVIDRGAVPVLYVAAEPLRQAGLTGVSQVSVRVTDPGNMSSVREAIEQQGFITSSVQDVVGQINKLFSVIDNILTIFCIVVFTITVGATFTIISLTLMEETRQIGFLRIMGLRHKDVKTLFYIQSILITTLGAVVGITFGFIVGFFINGYAQAVLDTQSFADALNVFVIPVLPSIMILILSVVVGWLVGVVPAKRAVLINPLEELLQ